MATLNPELDATGLILLKAETEEFFNKNHSRNDGRFTSGTGGSGGGSNDSKAPGFLASLSPREKKQAEEMTHGIVDPKKAEPGDHDLLKALAKTALAVGIYYGVSYGLKKGISSVVEKSLEKGLAEAAAEAGEAYTTKAADGRVLELLDSTGGKLTRDQRRELLGSLKEISDKVPLEGQPPRIVVLGTDDFAKNRFLAGSSGADAFVVGNHKTRTIYINHDTLFNRSEDAKGVIAHNAAEIRAGRQGHFMPAYLDNSEAKYTVFHEYGHLHDFNTREVLETSKQARHLRTVGLGSDKEFGYSEGLSYYGSSHPKEAYAETFAEYHLTGGRTTNKASQYYADQYDWKGAKK